MTEQKLNQLFESARNAQIETSQEEVTRWLATAAVAAVSAGAAATGFKLLLTKNALAMIIGTLSVAGIAIVSTAVFSGSSPEPVAENQNVVTYLDSNEKQVDSETAFYAVNIPVNENPSEDERVDANEYPVIIENQQPQIGNKTVRFEFPVTPMVPVTGMGTAPLRTIVYKDTARTAITSYEIPVESFSRLHIDGVFDVVIQQGDQEKVIVESSQQDVIQAESDGEVLLLTSTDSRNNSRCKDVNALVVHVTVKNLSELFIYGIGNVSVHGLDVPHLSVHFDGVGDLTMDLIRCQNFHLNATGVGNVYLSGESVSAIFEYDGVGDVVAYEFKVHTVHAHSTGVGNMYIYADETLTIDADGIGDIRYQGNPNLKELNFSGIGTLKSESEDKEGKPSDKGLK